MSDRAPVDVQVFIASSPDSRATVTWAVAVLDDGSEIRMRSLGDRVEIRTWDKSESCSPPPLNVTRVGGHVIDVRIEPERISGSLSRELMVRLGRVMSDTPEYQAACTVIEEFTR